MSQLQIWAGVAAIVVVFACFVGLLTMVEELVLKRIAWRRKCRRYRKQLERASQRPLAELDGLRPWAARKVRRNG